jgi:hypothetical protein
MPLIPRSFSIASTRPLRTPSGRSTWLASPVTIIFESWPEAGQEHQHLGGGGVLGFVENDDAFVERAAAHESERDHLDDVVDHEAFDLLEIHHVVQGVKQGTQIGVDLGLQVAGQEAQALAGLDRGAGQHEPAGGGRS